jgi:hypothetical protein
MRNDTKTTESTHASAGVSIGSILYHLRAAVACCIIPGEIDDGGLATRMPVLGLTMGIAFLVRSADGWWIFMGLLMVEKFGDTNGAAVEDKEIAGVTCCCG